MADNDDIPADPPAVSEETLRDIEEQAAIQEAIEQARVESEQIDQAEIDQLATELEQEVVDNREAIDRAGEELAQAHHEQARLEQEAFERESARLEEAHREQDDFERNSRELDQAHRDQEARQGESAGEQAGSQAGQLSREAPPPDPARLARMLGLMGVIAAFLSMAMVALRFNAIDTPTPVVRPGGTTLAPSAGANRAVVEVDYIHKSDGLNHTIRYSATGAVDTNGGTGTGEYQERGEFTAGNEPCSVTRSGRVDMRLVVAREISELTAKIQGPVQRQEFGDPNCSSNVRAGSQTDIVCVFQDVDLERGGRYQAEGPAPYREGGDINQESCTLVLMPPGAPR